MALSTAPAPRAPTSAPIPEEHFRQLAEKVPCIVWMADAEGRVRYINERWYQYTGLPPGMAEPAWPHDVIHPEDREIAARAWHRALATGEEHCCESRLRRRDGTYRWFETRATAERDAAGRILRWFGSTTDIDARKHADDIGRFLGRASAELARITEPRETLERIAQFAIPAFADWCGVFLCTPQGGVQRVVLANRDPAMVELLQRMRDRYPYRPSDPIGPGKVLRTGETDWSPHMRPEVLEAFAHDAEHLALLRQLDFRSWITVPIRLERRLGGAMSFVMSESGREYAESDVRAAEDLAHRVSIAIENHELVTGLREEDRRKDEFLAMLAHELRNPLAPIRNSLEILRVGGGPAARQEWIHGVVERQLRHLTRLVDDLLDVSRVRQGKIELRRERVAIAAAVQSALEASRPFIEQHGHDLQVSMPARPVHVDGDLTRLAQVIANLLNNAAKYSPRGGRIELLVERERDEVCVRVRDRGIGIPPEMLERIFDVFVQLDQALDRAQGGLGIGLTLARQLVRMHGGSIEARSEGVGRGAELVVRLPAAPSPPEERAPAAPAAAPASAARRILIVDDNRDSADTLAMLLRERGHDVLTAYDGEAGLEAALAFRPQIALLDIGLPKLHGYDLARAIRAALGSNVVLAAVTGFGQPADRRRCLEAGFDQHLPKPLELDALRELIAGR